MDIGPVLQNYLPLNVSVNTNVVVDSNTDLIFQGSGGTRLLIGEVGTSALTTFKVDDNQIRVGSNINGTLDEMWVCITPLGANATFLGTAEVLYYL